MPKSAATLLMFEGAAQPAIDLYLSVFKGAAVTRIERYGAGGPGAEGTVKRADATLAGHHLVFIDSPVKHGFTFTPSASIYVECADGAELEAAFATLSDGGQIFMPLDNYGFSTRFGWLSDRFGVSWQLNLE